MTLPCATDLIPSREARELAQAFRALGNPHRLAIYLRLLRHAESQGAVLHSCALQELIDKLDIGAPTISHHIKELVAAGLISVTRDGKYLRCTLNEAMRQRLAGTFDALAHQMPAQAL
ncbi:MAG: metalloregulator ArsR/SmtB family transcription factor [Pseudomonadota bacterium]